MSEVRGEDTGASRMRSRRVALAVMCVGLFLVQLDVTVVNVTLPSISGDLHTDVSGLQGVVDGYALVLGSLLLTAGTVGDRYGHRRVVVAGLMVFGVGSAACALAPGVGFLVGARAVQGLGAAMLLPGTLAVVTHAYPEREEQVRAVAAWAAVGGLALPAGPLVGGLLVEAAGWRWVFAVNVPIVVAAVVATLWVIPESRAAGGGRRLDVAGSVLAVVLLAAVTLAVVEARNTQLRALVIAAVVVAVVALVGFVVVERGQEQPMLPLGFFRRPAFTAGNLAAGAMNTAALGLLFVLTLFLQQLQHRSALAAGLALLPMFVPVTALAPVAGRLTGRFGPRPVAVTGLLVGAAGMLSLLAVGADSPYPVLLPVLVGLGVGLGLMTTPLVSSAMSAVPAEQAGLASGVNNALRQTGGAVGIALFGTLAGAATSPAFVPGLHRAAVVGAALYVAAAAGFLLGGPRRQDQPAQPESPRSAQDAPGRDGAGQR